MNYLRSFFDAVMERINYDALIYPLIIIVGIIVVIIFCLGFSTKGERKF